MKKFDKEKRRWLLLDWEALAEAVDVLEIGSGKYGDDNWKDCTDIPRYLNALFRHATAYAAGERADAETGRSHMAHVLCNAMFILSAERRLSERA